MSIRQTLFGIVVLASSTVVFAQATQEKPTDSGSAAGSSQLAVAPTPNPCGSRGTTLAPATILTDTMGVDFGPYMTTVVKTVRQNWYNLMPPSVYPPIRKQGEVSIEFVVSKDGKVSGVTLHKASDMVGLHLELRDVALNRAALASITASTPFPPLPPEFPGENLGLRFTFYYNTPVTGISISPCVDVRVPTGSTLRFVASGKDIADSSVTWSISGPGCSKSDCGSISDDGLYTAPANLPSLQTVIVEATSRTDKSITAKSRLTVVSANSPH